MRQTKKPKTATLKLQRLTPNGWHDVERDRVRITVKCSKSKADEVASAVFLADQDAEVKQHRKPAKPAYKVKRGIRS